MKPHSKSLGFGYACQSLLQENRISSVHCLDACGLQVRDVLIFAARRPWDNGAVKWQKPQFLISIKAKSSMATLLLFLTHCNQRAVYIEVWAGCHWKSLDFKLSSLCVVDRSYESCSDHQIANGSSFLLKTLIWEGWALLLLSSASLCQSKKCRYLENWRVHRLSVHFYFTCDLVCNACAQSAFGVLIAVGACLSVYTEHFVPAMGIVSLQWAFCPDLNCSSCFDVCMCCSGQTFEQILSVWVRWMPS